MKSCRRKMFPNIAYFQVLAFFVDSEMNAISAAHHGVEIEAFFLPAGASEFPFSSILLHGCFALWVDLRQYRFICPFSSPVSYRCIQDNQFGYCHT